MELSYPNACEADELFSPFVDKFYLIKNTATDSVSRYIAKLNLNSTLGVTENMNILLDFLIKTKSYGSNITEISLELFYWIIRWFILVITGPRLKEREKIKKTICWST